MRAGSEAVDLAAIAVPADKNLRAAATTHKQSARHFIGALRHINPQPSAVSSSLQPRADRACRRARASQGQALRVAAKTRPALTGPARDGCAIWRSGRKNARGAGRTKEWNLRTQYPNRYSTSPHPTGVAMFGIIPDRRSHQTIAGVGLFIAAFCQVSIVAGPLDPSAPLRSNRFVARFQGGQRLKCKFDCQWCNGGQQTRRDGVIQGLCRQRHAVGVRPG